MIFVIVSSKRSIHAFNSTVGNGSSSNVAGIKEESRSCLCGDLTFTLFKILTGNEDCIRVMLSVK